MEKLIEQGCLDLWIDSLVSCLKDTETCVVKVPKFMQGDTLSAGNNSAPDP